MAEDRVVELRSGNLASAQNRAAYVRTLAQIGVLLRRVTATHPQLGIVALRLETDGDAASLRDLIETFRQQ